LLQKRIDCGHFLLRPWRLSDKAALVRYANNHSVWRNLRDRFPYPYTEADADSWLVHAAGEPSPEGLYAIELAGEAAGTISVERGADIEHASAELGYWLGEPFWGQGIMTEAVRTVTMAALSEPDLFRLYASVFAWNPASMRVLEKAGYRREGVLVRSSVKDGVLLDRVLYAITRDPGLPYTPAARS